MGLNVTRLVFGRVSLLVFECLCLVLCGLSFVLGLAIGLPAGPAGLRPPPPLATADSTPASPAPASPAPASSTAASPTPASSTAAAVGAGATPAPIPVTTRAAARTGKAEPPLTLELGSFQSSAGAQAFARAAAMRGLPVEIAEEPMPDGATLWHVRTGRYADRALADQAVWALERQVGGGFGAAVVPLAMAAMDAPAR